MLEEAANLDDITLASPQELIQTEERKLVAY